MTSPNAETVDYQSARLGYHLNAQARRDAREALTGALKRKAEAEHSYRKGMSVAFAQQRAKGSSVQEAEIHARAAAADKALERDMADAEAKGASARLAELEAERASLRQLADWSRAVHGEDQ